MTKTDLKHALFAVADVNERSHAYPTGRKIERVNKAARKIFRPGLPYIHRRGCQFRNLTSRGLKRVQQFMKARGFDYQKSTWGELLDWLAENWDDILRVLISVVGLIIMFI